MKNYDRSGVCSLFEMAIRFADWRDKLAYDPHYDEIMVTFGVSRATAHRWLIAWRDARYNGRNKAPRKRELNTRLFDRIMKTLELKPMTVHELAQALSVTDATIRHMAKIMEASEEVRWVEDKKKYRMGRPAKKIAMVESWQRST
jgi:transposase